MSVSIAMRVVYVFVCLFLVMYYKYLFIIYNNIDNKIDESKHFEVFIFAKLIIMFIIINIRVFWSMLIIKLDLNFSILKLFFISITLNKGIIID